MPLILPPFPIITKQGALPTELLLAAFAELGSSAAESGPGPSIHQREMLSLGALIMEASVARQSVPAPSIG